MLLFVHCDGGASEQAVCDYDSPFSRYKEFFLVISGL